MTYCQRMASRSNARLRLGARAVRIRPHRSPELCHEPLVIGIAALGDDGPHNMGPAQSEAPADWGTVVLNVHRVSAQAELVEQFLDDTGQGVERVVELLG